MKNSLIIEYAADDIYEFATKIFDTTKEMAEALNKSIKNCQNLLTKKSNCKGYKYERVWLNREC